MSQINDRSFFDATLQVFSFNYTNVGISFFKLM